MRLSLEFWAWLILQMHANNIVACLKDNDKLRLNSEQQQQQQHRYLEVTLSIWIMMIPPILTILKKKKSPKTSKRKKKDIDAYVTLGSLLKKAKTSEETSKEKENVCDVSASAGSSSSNKLPPCLTVEGEPNDPPVLPGFAPEFNLVETMDSVDEDDMTIAEILRSKNVKFMDGDSSSSHSRDFSSSVADNEAAKIVEPPTELLEKIMQNEFVKGDSGTVLEDAAERTSGSPDNDTVMIQSSELEGNKYATELIECQLERISRLEKIFAELKASKFGLSRHN
ncbi:hypothetical protein LWI29_000628 [Acer saccharum]|uniref:Uncharacterized protein n=1 Tax=Acer saccharum TaxID=4024 RepID=A0AA39SNX7_ACESA|nr:hypothetical protein LWI29_000628 [Acer saccharum]